MAKGQELTGVWLDEAKHFASCPKKYQYGGVDSGRWVYPGSVTMIGNENVTRFRSFAERYVIERASAFTSGSEKQDAWLVIDDAKKIYEQIARVAEREYGPKQETATQVSAMQRQHDKNVLALVDQLDAKIKTKLLSAGVGMPSGAGALTPSMMEQAMQLMRSKKI